jgi:site-specific DNA-cytosine methylase
MKVLSLYSGGGGIEQGLKQAGIKTTLAIDVDIDCCKTLKLNHECEVIHGKVGDYKESFGKADVIVGGPPCPEFSNAKSNRTYDATEVNIFWEIVDRIKPKYFLMENVPGVIKVCKRRNFLINAADYGTPQTRIRRFFTNIKQPKATHSKNSTQTLLGDKLKKWVSVREALQLPNKKLILQDRKTTFGDGFRNYNPDKPCFTLLADYRAWISPTGFKKANIKTKSNSIDQPSMTIVIANDYQITDKPVYSEKYIKYKNDFKVEYKLSNEECSILQGFPKGYKFHGNIANVKKQIGNAVPSQPIQAIFEQLLY